MANLTALATVGRVRRASVHVRRGRPPRQAARRPRPWGLMAVWAVGCSCQGYPFEVRLPERIAGRQLSQTVATLVPVDVLFVIDNSGSMLAQRLELIANLGQFAQQMVASTTDFHLGIMTTDVECNVPGRSCTPGAQNVSEACCQLVQAGNLRPCTQLGTEGDENSGWSDCDAGRLRAPRGGPAYFSRPSGDTNAWVAQVAATISDLGCNGSGYESGLEAARRAIACAQGSAACPDPNVATRNAGFLRPEADLAVVFITDEDDCSFADPNTYLSPPDPTQLADQATHLCSPAECYAYWGQGLDADGNGLQDWADPSAYAQDGGVPPLTCGSGVAPIHRQVNPPSPEAVQSYLDFLVAAKGGDVGRVRAAAIAGSVVDATAPLGARADACVNVGVGVTADGQGTGSAGLGVTSACGCWSANVVSDAPGTHNLYCALTDLLHQIPSASPANSTSNECSSVGTGAAELYAPQPGCKALPSGRYVQLLQALGASRQAAGLRQDTLLDTVCRASYSQTMFDIVNTVILDPCFDLGCVPAAIGDIDVRKNGVSMAPVAQGSADPGFSWRVGSRQICLEGGMKKNLGDQFAIFVLQPS